MVSQRICSSENWKLFDTGRLDLTPCSEDALVALPLVIILVGGFFEYARFHNLESKERHGWRAKGLLNVKLVLASTIILVSLFQLILGFVTTPNDPVGNIASIVAFVSYLPSIFLHHITHTRSRRSSTTLLFFWLSSTIIYFLKLRTFLEFSTPANNPIVFSTLLVLSVLTLTVFVLECKGPECRRIMLGDTADDSWRESPYTIANAFSRLTFSWMTPMMKHGYTKYIQEEDLWALPENDKVEYVSRRFEKYLSRQMQKKNPKVIIALCQAFGKPFLFAAFLKACQDILAFAQPQLLKRLLTFVENYNSKDGEPIINGYILAFLMFACAIIQTAVLHQYFQRCYDTGMRIRAAIISSIYEKSLRLSSDEKGARQTGDIVNLQSTDALRLCDFCTYGQIAWSGLFQLTLAFISLYDLLGPYGLIGVAIMVLSLPLNALIARIQSRMQFQQMKVKDKRTRLMSEILNNIRSIKLYAWESAFSRRLLHIRNDKELVLLRKMGLIQAGSQFIWTFSPFLVSFATFAVFSATSGKPLTSQIVFPAISLFQLLSFPLAVIPMVLTAGVEAYVALGRLSSFLMAKELQKDAVIRKPLTTKPALGDELLRVEGGDFSWNSNPAPVVPTLQDINVSVKKGQLLSVIGSVGSGKSSLLSAMIGDMIKTDGTVTISGSVAYVPQQAWIMGGTVRDNITFGHRFDPDFYEKTLDACALREDLAILPDGDQSEVGEKGLTLSGGQKARVTLARAVYARSDVYLLDDPLSAVDSHVAKHLFNEVIGPNGLLGTKARVLCTNALAFAKDSDHLAYIRKGTIYEQGTYDEIMKNINGELARLLTEHSKHPQEDSSSSSPSSSKPSSKPSSVAGGRTGTGTGTEEVESSDDTVVIEDDTDVNTVPDMDGKNGQGIRRLSHVVRRASMISIERQRKEALFSLKASTRPKEHSEVGSVKKEIYSKYIKSNGYVGVIGYLSLILGSQAFQIWGNYWLKNWAQHNADYHNNGNLTYYLGIYLSLGFAQSFCSVLNVVVLYCLCIIRSAKIMHDGMFSAVMRAPMQFFETTPIGVVLNRFSRDVYVADEVLARTFGSFFRVVASVVGVVFVIGSSAPIFLVICVPLFFLYKTIQRYYLKTSRELKRLDSTTRSPIFASFSETLAGLSTIRAFGQTRRFSALNEARVERNQEAYFLSIVANRWLAVRLEFIGAVVILSTALSAVFTMSRGNLNSGLAGLMLSYALSLTQSLNWTVRTATEIETNIVSVERITEYQNLEPEAPMEIEATKPADSWPEFGTIEFDNFSMKYRPHLDPVLNRITFKVEPNEKIGICGRTGAGKSSLTMALFRVVEGFEGQILIDGVDIGTIGLHDLRSKLSIIPQDSQCFDGTIRDNVDPVGVYSDAEVWRALEQARMKDHIMSMNGALDAHVEEGGGNLSAGQRQLMCLARALLRRSKILVLDEATSSADAETDAAVQEVIRSEFVNCTILTIAHRLNTIVDSSKVLSMSHGNVVEYDTPKNLFSRENSLFYSLCKQAGIEHID